MQLFQWDLAIYTWDTLSLSDLCKYTSLIFHRTWTAKSLQALKKPPNLGLFPYFSFTRWNTILNRFMKGNQTKWRISQLLKSKPNNICHLLNILFWRIIQLGFRFSKLNIQNIHSWDEIKYENFCSESSYFKNFLVTENRCIIMMCHPLLL